MKGEMGMLSSLAFFQVGATKLTEQGGRGRKSVLLNTNTNEITNTNTNRDTNTINGLAFFQVGAAKPGAGRKSV